MMKDNGSYVASLKPLLLVDRLCMGFGLVTSLKSEISMRFAMGIIETVQTSTRFVLVAEVAIARKSQKVVDLQQAHNGNV